MSVDGIKYEENAIKLFNFSRKIFLLAFLNESVSNRFTLFSFHFFRVKSKILFSHNSTVDKAK